MSQVTFSGPIRSGTVREGAAPNIGQIPLVQVTTIPFSAMLTAPAAVVIARLPAGSKILDFTVEKVVAIATATDVGITFGVQGGSATQYCTSFNTGVALGKTAVALADAAQVVANTNNVGTSDVVVTATPTAATGNATAGSIVVTTRYIQRNADGT